MTPGNAIDVHIGARVRHRRRDLGLTPGQLAERLCVPTSQILDYERGLVRIGASRLYDLCLALQTQAAYFLQDLVAKPACDRPANDLI